MSESIVKNRIAGTRITVWDVLHYRENGCSTEEICKWLPITVEQVTAAFEYIDANQDDVMRVHREIEERNARGNPPEVLAKLAESRRNMQAWLRDKRKLKTAEHDRAGHSG